MKKLRDVAFTGNSERGNPYSGNIENGIEYDRYEANTNIIEQNGNAPFLCTPYRAGARQLVGYVSAEKGDIILDIGSGTGICTLEILCQHPENFVIGIDISEGMLQTALYKFNKTDAIPDNIEDKKLLKYWKSFREESLSHKERAEFILDDFQAMDIEGEIAGSAAANQFMHWTDLSKTFGQLRKSLKPGGEAVWNTASHFFNDANFPASDYGFRYNDFMGYVMKEIGNNFDTEDYRKLSNPAHNIKTIREITSGEGFETEQIATYLQPVDLQVFVKNHVPAFIRELTRSSDDCAEELEIAAKDAISKTIANPDALSDNMHKYDIIPVFRSKKQEK